MEIRTRPDHYRQPAEVLHVCCRITQPGRQRCADKYGVTHGLLQLAFAGLIIYSSSHQIVGPQCALYPFVSSQNPSTQSVAQTYRIVIFMSRHKQFV